MFFSIIIIQNTSSISDAETSRARTRLDLDAIRKALKSSAISNVDIVYYQGDSRGVAEMVRNHLDVVRKSSLIKSRSVLLGDVKEVASSNGDVRLRVRQILPGGGPMYPSMMTPAVDPGNVSIVHGRAPFGINGDSNPGLISVYMSAADHDKLDKAVAGLNGRVHKVLGVAKPGTSGIDGMRKRYRIDRTRDNRSYLSLCDAVSEYFDPMTHETRPNPIRVGKMELSTGPAVISRIQKLGGFWRYRALASVREQLINDPAMNKFRIGNGRS